MSIINEMSERLKIIFPVHPRTKNAIESSKSKLSKNIILTNPLSYLKFLGLIYGSNLVVTDSGGIQEETTFLGIQCITIRDNTERPVTIEMGTNHLVGTNIDSILNNFNAILDGKIKNGKIPPKWDGKTSNRIAKIIKQYIT